MIQEKNTTFPEDPPPIFKKWSRFYWLVLANLTFWLIAFYIVRRIFE